MRITITNHRGELKQEAYGNGTALDFPDDAHVVVDTKVLAQFLAQVQSTVPGTKDQRHPEESYPSLDAALADFARMDLDQLVTLQGGKVYPEENSKHHPGFGPGFHYMDDGSGSGRIVLKGAQGGSQQRARPTPTPQPTIILPFASTDEKKKPSATIHPGYVTAWEWTVTDRRPGYFTFLEAPGAGYDNVVMYAVRFLRNGRDAQPEITSNQPQINFGPTDMDVGDVCRVEATPVATETRSATVLYQLALGA